MISPPPLLVSFVFNTYKREQSFEQMLEGLRYLDYPGAEVVVANDPLADGTALLLGALKGRGKIARCSERTLSVLRNVAVCATADEFVAFIDEAVAPEPEWLDQLLMRYDAPTFHASGGIVYDRSGYTIQCQRRGTAQMQSPPAMTRRGLS